MDGEHGFVESVASEGGLLMLGDGDSRMFSLLVSYSVILPDGISMKS